MAVGSGQHPGSPKRPGQHGNTPAEAPCRYNNALQSIYESSRLLTPFRVFDSALSNDRVRRYFLSLPQFHGYHGTHGLLASPGGNRDSQSYDRLGPGLGAGHSAGAGLIRATASSAMSGLPARNDEVIAINLHDIALDGMRAKSCTSFALAQPYLLGVA